MLLREADARPVRRQRPAGPVDDPARRERDGEDDDPASCSPSSSDLGALPTEMQKRPIPRCVMALPLMCGSLIGRIGRQSQVPWYRSLQETSLLAYATEFFAALLRSNIERASSTLDGTVMDKFCRCSSYLLRVRRRAPLSHPLMKQEDYGYAQKSYFWRHPRSEMPRNGSSGSTTRPASRPRYRAAETTTGDGQGCLDQDPTGRLGDPLQSLERRQADPRCRVQDTLRLGPTRQLGYGYRTMIAWVIDFTGRMVDATPTAPTRSPSRPSCWSMRSTCTCIPSGSAS